MHAVQQFSEIADAYARATCVVKVYTRKIFYFQEADENQVSWVFGDSWISGSALENTSRESFGFHC